MLYYTAIQKPSSVFCLLHGIQQSGPVLIVPLQLWLGTTVVCVGVYNIRRLSDLTKF